MEVYILSENLSGLVFILFYFWLNLHTNLSEYSSFLISNFIWTIQYLKNTTHLYYLLNKSVY